MVRQAVAFVALALLPALSLAQDVPTHTVERGNTLWSLAVRYYGDGFEWSRIYEANRDRVGSPEQLVPGTVLRIPDAMGQVTEVAVSTPDQAEPTPEAAEPTEPAPTQMGLRPMRAAPPQERPRSIFYRSLRPMVGEGTTPIQELMQVTADERYAAPWRLTFGESLAASGTVAGLAGGETFRTAPRSALPADRVAIDWRGAQPVIGAGLQTFRRGRMLPGERGTVIVPSGRLFVDETGPGGIVAKVLTEYDRVLVGDLVQVAPPFTPTPEAQMPDPSGPREATIVELADDHPLQSFGDHVFLDVGGSDRVRVGDEYLAFVGRPDGSGVEIEGAVRVVDVRPSESTAVIVQIGNPVFVVGARLRLGVVTP